MLNQWEFYENNKSAGFPPEYSFVWNKAIVNSKIKLNITPLLILAKMEIKDGFKYAFLGFVNPEDQAPMAKKRVSKIIIKNTKKENKIIEIKNIL